MCFCTCYSLHCFTAHRKCTLHLTKAFLVVSLTSFMMQEDGCPPAKRRRMHAEPEPRCSVSGEFRDVPPELLRRILGFLSAHDLCAAVALACRGLRCAAADDVLWRRLYKARYCPAASLGLKLFYLLGQELGGETLVHESEGPSCLFLANKRAVRHL